MSGKGQNLRSEERNGLKTRTGSGQSVVREEAETERKNPGWKRGTCPAGALHRRGVGGDR